MDSFLVSLATTLPIGGLTRICVRNSFRLLFLVLATCLAASWSGEAFGQGHSFTDESVEHYVNQNWTQESNYIGAAGDSLTAMVFGTAVNMNTYKIRVRYKVIIHRPDGTIANVGTGLWFTVPPEGTAYPCGLSFFVVSEVGSHSVEVVREIQQDVNDNGIYDADELPSFAGAWDDDSFEP